MMYSLALDDSAMEVDQPFASQCSNDSAISLSGDRIVWNPTQTIHKDLRVLQDQAAQAARTVHCPSPFSEYAYASMPFSEHAAAASASTSSIVSSSRRPRASARIRVSTGSPSHIPSSAVSSTDASDFTALFTTVSAKVDKNARDKKRYQEHIQQKESPSTRPRKIASVAPNSRNEAGSVASSSVSRSSSSASTKRTHSPGYDSVASESMDIDALSYVSGNAYGRDANFSGSRRRALDASVIPSRPPTLALPPKFHSQPKQESQHHDAGQSKTSRSSKASFTPPAHDQLLPSVRPKPPAAAPPTKAEYISQSKPFSTASATAPRATPAFKPTQSKAGPPALGMRRAPYSGSTSFAPSQTLPTKQRGFRPPLMRPRVEQPTATPGSTPSPAPRVRSAAHLRPRPASPPPPPPAPVPSRSPSPPAPMDADSSYGDLSLGVDPDELESMMQQYD